MARTIKTIRDMEDYYYVQPFNNPTMVGMVSKSAGPVLSSTPNVYNPKYGAQLWSQLNHEANVFGAMPKSIFKRTGWRLVTARSETLGSGGVAENSTLPTANKPNIDKISTLPKEVVHVFEASEKQVWLTADSEDDAALSVEELRKIRATEHKEHLNKMLVGDVDTLAGNNFESIDRVVSGFSESTLVTPATDVDIYGKDRSTGATILDAYVNHASGVDRALTDALIRESLTNVAKNGGNTQFMLTGYDTYNAMLGLYQQFIRYLGEQQVSFSVNGVETSTGIKAGYTVATIYGKPVIVSKDVPIDTISRLYFLDTSDPENFGMPRLSVAIAKPTQYFESADPIAVDKFSVKGVYRTMGELICTRFNGQGKLRDLL